MGGRRVGAWAAAGVALPLLPREAGRRPLLAPPLLARLTLCRCARPTRSAHPPQDIRPKAGGPPVGPKLMRRGDVAKMPYTGKFPTFKNPCC